MSARFRRMITVHTEHIGSLLRPAELLKARVELDRRSLTPREFQAIEDAAVEHVLSLQHQAGCEVVTDGEYRRVSFQSVLVEGTEGLGEWDLETFLWGDWYGDGLEPWHRPRPESLGVAGKLVRKRHRAVEEFQYVRDRTDRIVKVTLPSPSLLANFWSAERSKPVYPTLETFLDDVALLVKSEVSELARLGCEYVQLDAPHYPLLLDEKTRSFYQRQGLETEKWLRLGIELDNGVIDSFPELSFGIHLCRGNQGSRWLVSGSYEAIAEELFGSVHAARLLLEYDDERSGGFAPLRFVPADKTVVLGLVTTKSPRLESVASLIGRIEEAAAYIDLDRLALSPQCGFSTSIVGNAISEECELAKLRVIAETAREVWC